MYDTTRIITPIYTITCPIRHSLNQAYSWLEAKGVVLASMPDSTEAHARVRMAMSRIEITLRDLDAVDASVARLKARAAIPPEDRYDDYEGDNEEPYDGCD